MKKPVILLIAVFAGIFFISPSAYPKTYSKYGYPQNNGYNAGVSNLINSFDVYFSEDYMHYAEHSVNGTNAPLEPAGYTYDNEAAKLPGWGMDISYFNKRLPIYYELNISNNAGDSNYSGGLECGGVPCGYSSSIDGLMYLNYGAKLGYVFLLNGGQLALIPNIGYEYSGWNRNVINPDGSSNVEHYKLDHWLLGALAYIKPLNSNFWAQIYGYYTDNYNNSMYRYSDTLGESVTYGLGSGTGYIFGGKIGYEAYKNNNFIISPYIGINYIQNKEGRSNNIYYPNNTYTWEPQDQSNQFFASVGLKISY
jgi:hypothetical protein